MQIRSNRFPTAPGVPQLRPRPEKEADDPPPPATPAALDFRRAARVVFMGGGLAAGALSGATPVLAQIVQTSPQPDLLQGAQNAVARPYQAPGENEWHPPTDESERTPELVQEQESRLRWSLDNAQTTTLTNSEGRTVTVRLERSALGFHYRMDDRVQVDVTFDPSCTADQQLHALGQIVDYHSQEPAGLVDVLARVNVRTRPPESNTMANFSYCDKTMTIFGLDALTEGNFTHEIGHAVGSKIEKEDDTLIQWLLGGAENRVYKSHVDCVPDAWADLMLREAPISTYARTGPQEDFADSWSAYVEARESGPDALQRLHELFPERCQVLDDIWARAQNPDFGREGFVSWVRSR